MSHNLCVAVAHTVAAHCAVSSLFVTYELYLKLH